jgi:competence protein ComEC
MRLPAGFLGAATFVAGVGFQISGLIVPMVVVAVGAVVIAWIWTEERRVAVVGLILVALMVLGGLRAAGTPTFPQAPDGLHLASEFNATVIDVPNRYPTATHVRLKVDDPATTRAWGQLPSFPDVAQGDRLRITGRFIPNDQTSFRGFSAQRDTSGLLVVDRHTVTGNEASSIQRSRTTIAGEIRSRLAERIPEPAGAFATGVILGDDGAMTEATRHSFRVGGLTHMTAVSGVHVGIIAAAILLFSSLGIVSRWWTLGLSVPLVWSFAYLVGMRPSVVRASLMLTLLIIANLLGRPRDTLNAVGLAAALMLAVDPTFAFDIGFQLSVAATTGIAIGIPLVSNRSHWHLVWVVPLSAQVVTEPLILYHFGYYSLVSPLANILAAPFLAMTMALGLLTLFASLMSGFLADVLALATWVPATAVVTIANFAAQIPVLSDDVRPLSSEAVWVVYAVMIAIAIVSLEFAGESGRDGEGEYSVLYRV